MEKDNEMIKRWRKNTALFLSTAILAAFAPGAVYGAAVSGNADIPDVTVSGDTTPHAHQWVYTKNQQEVTAECQGQGCEAGKISLTLKVEKESDYAEEPQASRVSVSANGMPLLRENEWGIQYEIQYFQDADGMPGHVWSGEGEPREPGTYHVKVAFAGGDSALIEDTFTIRPIEKESRSGITVNMKSHYDLKGQIPVPQLNPVVEDGAEVTYYYNTKPQNTGGEKWSASRGKKLKSVTYFMYAVIGETDKYKSYTTPVCDFTVHTHHKWNMPKDLSAKSETKKTISCSYCGEKHQIKLPKKQQSVVMGKTLDLGKKAYTCTFVETKETENNKIYFQLNEKGKMTTKLIPADYASMPDSVPVKIKVTDTDKTYTIKVKLKVRPNVTVATKKVNINGVPAHRFEFDYSGIRNIRDAKRVQVWISKGDTDRMYNSPNKAENRKKVKELNNYFEKYFKNPRPSEKPFINLFNRSLKKIRDNVTFNIRVYYGSKKSEIREETVPIG